jgi:hypothetical protein
MNNDQLMFIRHTMVQTWEEFIPLFCILYFIAPCGYYIVMAKIPRFPSETPEIVKL